MIHSDEDEDVGDDFENYIKEKYQKVELQFYHQKEQEKFQKKFKFLKKI